MWLGFVSRSRSSRRTTITKVRLPPNCKQACQPMCPLSAKWKMHRTQYERSSECLHVWHRSVVLRGVRYRLQAECYQRSPWAEQAPSIATRKLRLRSRAHRTPLRQCQGLTSRSDSEHRAAEQEEAADRAAAPTLLDRACGDIDHQGEQCGIENK